MGEIADMMLNGDLCELCGVTLPGSGGGFPRYCHGCRRPTSLPGAKQAKKVRCAVCSRMVKATGLADHTRVMHRPVAPAGTPQQEGAGK